MIEVIPSQMRICAKIFSFERELTRERSDGG